MCGATAFAFDEEAERDALSKFNKSIYDSLINPACDALIHNHPQEALSLYKKALTKWQSAHFQSKSSKETQSLQIGVILRSEAQILIKLGRYEEAARTYMLCAAEQEKRDHLSKKPYMREIGQTFAQGKLYGKAEKFYKEVIKLGSPGEKVWAHLDLSSLYRSQGQMQQAVSELEDFLSDSKQPKQPTETRSLRIALRNLYSTLNRKDDANKIETQLQDQHCPVCGSAENVEPIRYGLVRGPIVGFHPGGCSISPDSPQWWCKTDKLAF